MESTLVNKKDLEFLNQDIGEEKKLKFVAAPAKIISVVPWGIAKEIGLEPGDQILEINGTKLRDIMDFQFEFSQADEVELLVKRKDETELISFDKDIDEELGAEFETPLFNGVQECANKCTFCFIDQQPMEMTRKSLHLKDDDFRLSYLHGSYVTLTNLSRSDRKRIEELRPGPLYISVHATEPELRNHMLGRKQSVSIIDELKWLDSLDIPCHTQIVLCPGLNDGEHLTRTLDELYELKDKPVRSVAIVPVGLTKYHSGGLKRFGFDDALETISQIEKWNQAHGNDFAFLSDEFYLMTETPIPNYAEYGGYPQLEDGVGVTSLFLDEFSQATERLPKKINKAKTITWVNGTLAQNTVQKIANIINDKVENLEVKIAAVDSKFWGITNVVGLLTGKDLLEALEGKDLGDAVILPSVMLKENEDIFLDDMHISELEKELGVPCIKAWGAQEFIDCLIA